MDSSLELLTGPINKRFICDKQRQQDWKWSVRA